MDEKTLQRDGVSGRGMHIQQKALERKMSKKPALPTTRKDQASAKLVALKKKAEQYGGSK